MKGRGQIAVPTLAAAILFGSTSHAVFAAAAAASGKAAMRAVDSSWRRDIIGISPTAWNAVMAASGRLALLDLHDLYVRDASQLLIRGGASGYSGSGSGYNNMPSTGAVDPRRPHMSVSTAWSKLPSSGQSSAAASQQTIDDIQEDTSLSKSPLPASNEQPSITTVGDDKKSVSSRSVPRAGSMIRSASSSSPSLLATTLAAIWAGWNVLNGALLTFTPKESYDMVAYLVEAIGVVRISHGLQLFLSTVASVPSKMSMGVAILPRLLFLVACLGLKTYGQLGMEAAVSPMVLVSAGIMSATALALISDKGRPNLMANIFSTMTFAKGCGMMFRPERTAAKLFGFDGTTSSASAAAANLGKVPSKVRSLGFHLMISAVFMNALTHSINPIRAAGYSAVTWFLLLADLTFSVGKYPSLSAIPRTYLFFLASALSCSVVFLTDEGRKVSDGLDDVSSGRGGEGDQMVWEHSANVPLQFDEQPPGNEYVVEEVDGDATSSSDSSS